MTPRKNLTIETCADAIRSKRGNLAAVARAFKITRQAVWDFVQTHSDVLNPVVKEARETMKDDGEEALYVSVKKREGWAVKFYLATQAKDRGYVERYEFQDATDEQVNAAIAAELAKLAARSSRQNADAPSAGEHRDADRPDISDRLGDDSSSPPSDDV